MLFSNPVPGVIHVGAEYYPTAPGAWKRPVGNRDFVLTHDFGPSDLSVEPTVAFTQDGDEYDIYGKLIPTGTYPDFHLGIDLGNGHSGDLIHAAAPGTVESAGVDATGARFVILNHGMINGHVFRTQYWHASTLGVVRGATVADQQSIGAVGSSGLSTGAHLHFGVTIDGKPVDPWRRLRQNGYPDPDAPKEAEMILTKNLFGYTATIAVPYKIRTGPTLTASVLRVLASPETWTLLGTVKGDLANGSDQWYVRVVGLAFEFVHAGAVSGLSAPAPSAPPPPPPVDIDAIKRAQYDLDAASIVVDDPPPIVTAPPATARLGNPRP